MTISNQLTTNNAGSSPCTPEAHQRADFVRASLFSRFGAVDFDVSEQLGGNEWALSIEWTNGPNTAEVRHVLKGYSPFLLAVIVEPVSRGVSRFLAYGN